ncbi:MAG TPA: metal ABC transporter substrate-binding protein [Candidatus Limnocylindrales bacterium]|nr:metal ABC transporter substrate-binding protein [Candidatus Limnocylindrales bacterium]
MKLAIALIAALALAGCAGGGPAPAPTSGESPAASPAETASVTPTREPGTETPTASPDAQASPSPDTAQLSVVATTTVLADFVRKVAGDRAEVHALVPAGVDPHTFDPSPSDAVRVSEADLLVMNGLGLDEWVQPFIEQAGAGNVRLVELAEDLDGVDYLEGDDHHDEDEHGDDDEHHDEDEDDHAYNPHLWMNVQYARLYVERLADELSAVDPANESDYRGNAAAYDGELEELDGWIRGQIGSLPEDDRRVISFHHAFPYFAEAYGMQIVGVLVEVPGREPSAGEVAALISAIRESGVRLILAEAQFSDALAQTLAAETEAEVVSTLYTDALGDPPADTFAGAMRWNVEQILQALE